MAIEQGDWPSAADIRHEKNLSANRSLDSWRRHDCASGCMAPIHRTHNLRKSADLYPPKQQRSYNRFLNSCLDIDKLTGVVDGYTALHRTLLAGRVIRMPNVSHGE